MWGSVSHLESGNHKKNNSALHVDVLNIISQWQNNIQNETPKLDANILTLTAQFRHDVQNIRRKHRLYASACLIIIFFTITLIKGFSLIYRNFAFEFNNWLPVSCSVWWFSKNSGHNWFLVVIFTIWYTKLWLNISIQYKIMAVFDDYWQLQILW